MSDGEERSSEPSDEGHCRPGKSRSDRPAGGGIQLEPGPRSGFWEASITDDLQPGMRLNEKTESPPPIYGPE